MRHAADAAVYAIKAKSDAPVDVSAGDFYELDDAVTAARELEITLKARNKGKGSIPMFGVPYQSVRELSGAVIRRATGSHLRSMEGPELACVQRFDCGIHFSASISVTRNSPWRRRTWASRLAPLPSYSGQKAVLGRPQQASCGRPGVDHRAR